MDNLWITFLDTGGGFVYTYYNTMGTAYITKLCKIGTSQGVIIPKNILNAYHWQRGDFLIFGFSSDDQIFVRRLNDLEINQLKPDVHI